MKHGIEFENIILEDELFNFEVFRRNPLVIITDCDIYRYMRDNYDSITSSKVREKQLLLQDGRVYVMGIMNNYLRGRGVDMMEGLKWSICGCLERFYLLSFYLHYSRTEWIRYMRQIRIMDVNKFLYERESTMKRRLIVFLKCSASHFYLLYLIAGFLHRNVYSKIMI